MKITLMAMATFLLTSSVFAGCVDDFRLLQDKSKVALKKMRVVEVRSQRDLKKLRSAELKAVSNYLEYMSFEFNGENSLEVTNEQYQSKKLQESLGYRISVTDGGDESNVRYYIKIDVGMEDVAYPILYRIWDNQSPEYTWLCERF